MPYQAYEDEDELRRIQLAIVPILAEFHRVCHELDIPYVVYGGTAIGAVRHHGFVPWDDDIDVVLPRASYERFLREAPAVLAGGFALANARNTPDFPSTYSQLTAVGTRFVPEYYKDSEYQPRLNIDVFPLDNAADDPKALARQCRATWLWGRLKFLRATGAPYVPLEGWKRSLVLGACALAHWGLRTAHVSPAWIQKHWERAARSHEHEDTRLMADFSDRAPMDWAVTMDDMFPAVEVPFEDITVMLPRNYDEILTRGYRDYMTLPPVEKRKNHHPYLVDLGSAGH